MLAAPSSRVCGIRLQALLKRVLDVAKRAVTQQHVVHASGTLVIIVVICPLNSLRAPSHLCNHSLNALPVPTPHTAVLQGDGQAPAAGAADEKTAKDPEALPALLDRLQQFEVSTAGMLVCSVCTCGGGMTALIALVSVVGTCRPVIHLCNIDWLTSLLSLVQVIMHVLHVSSSSIGCGLELWSCCSG